MKIFWTCLFREAVRTRPARGIRTWNEWVLFPSRYIEGEHGAKYFVFQIQELETNLRRETIAKTDMLAKIAEAEVQNVKFKSELTMSLTTITQLQSTISMLEVRDDFPRSWVSQTIFCNTRLSFVFSIQTELDKLKDGLRNVGASSSARTREETVITPTKGTHSKYLVLESYPALIIHHDWRHDSKTIEFGVHSACV